MLTAFVVVSAMQIMGVILVVAMLVVPVATAALVARSFERSILLAILAAELAAVPEDEDVLFQAADYMEQDGLTAFDAYHVVYADGDPLLSSDDAFDGVTDDRIAIEDHESE